MSLYPEASYTPDYTVFRTDDRLRSYMAKRVRNRPQLERFHFSELMTSRPIHHYAIAVAAEKHALLQDSSDRSKRRRDDPEWRHVATPILLGNSINFTEDLAQAWRRIAVWRQRVPLTYEFRDPGKASAKVPLPPLSLAFLELVRVGSKTAEEIIQDVLSQALTWRTLKPFGMQNNETSLAPNTLPDALTYREVSAQLFDWLDQMEATMKVLCIRTR